MLQTIKDYISNLPDKDFGSYYQEFICETQDRIIESDANGIQARFVSLDNVNDILSGINKLTEELKVK